MHGSDATDDTDRSVDTLLGELAAGDTREDDALLQAVAAAPPKRPPSRDHDARPLPGGTVVDETFRIDGVLGRGAMGVVYLATDLQLDRQVALKLHASPHEDVHTSRMWREARAMARLAHPNVLTVHEVGLHENRVYIAMECVEGMNLREWSSTARAWREVVDVFVQAAHGLAAAHRVGLVHRDFKPSNVLLDAEGRVRVADFGLARVGGDDAQLDATRSEPTGSSLSRTRTGVAVGTPAYMAPEQFGGGVVDHRSDQFAFCVALHEALYGMRPFEGDTIGEMHAAAAGGRVRLAVPGRRVPGWLRAIVLRGLQPRPEDRLRDMNAVIAALKADPTRRRRLLMLSSAAFVAGLVAWGTVGVEREWRRTSCRAQAEGIDTVWNDVERQRLREGAIASSAFLGADAFEHARPYLDTHAHAWRQRYADLCIATEVDQVRTADQWSASQACLDERRAEIGELVDVFADPLTRAAAQNLVEASALLPPPDVCGEDEWLRRHPRREPASAELRAKLMRATSLDAAGRAVEASALVERLLSQIEDSSSDLRVEVLAEAAHLAYELGRPVEASERAREGFDTALSGGNDSAAAAAAATLAFTTGRVEARHDEGLRWARIASSLLTRSGGDDDPRAAEVHTHLGLLYEALGRWEEATREHEAALEIHERRRGSTHPSAAGARVNLSAAHRIAGRSAEAAAEAARALELFTSSFGPDHVRVGKVFGHLGISLAMQGEFEEAERALTESRAIFERTLGPDHPDVGLAHMVLGWLYAQLGRSVEAEAEYRRGVAVADRLGPSHPFTRTARFKLGLFFAGEHRPAEAERELSRALSLFASQLGDDHAEVGFTLVELAMVRLELGRTADAARDAERAIAILARKRPKSIGVSAARFLLARATWDGGGDRLEARALAEQAREGFAGAGIDHKEIEEEFAEVEAWLVEHPIDRRRQLPPSHAAHLDGGR